MAGEPVTRSLEACLRLSLNADRTQAVLRIAPGAPAGEVSADALLAYLTSKAVVRACTDDDAVARLARAYLDAPSESHEAQVCRSTPAEHGEDGGVTLSAALQERLDCIENRARALRQRARGDTPAAQQGPGDPDDDEAKDFYNQSAFLVVREGAVIATLTAPTPGVDGVDIFGEAILAKPGRSLEMSIDATIKPDREGRLTARASGRLLHEPASLKIETVLRIEGSVDFSTGNIDFPGDVQIVKGVKDRFVVRAEGDLVVGELAEACTLETLGSLTLNNGMAGRESGRLDVTGDLDARYIDAVSGRIEGALRVHRELTNCELATGRIDSPACVVRGGVLSAAKGVDLNTVGSESGSRTELRLGHSPRLNDLLDAAQEALPGLTARLASAEARLKHLTSLPRQTEQEMEEQITLDMQRAQVQTRVDELRGVVVRALDTIAARTSPWLRVRKAIYAQSVIALPGFVARFDRDVRGPIEIEPGEDGPPIFRAGPDDPPKPLASVANVAPDTTVVRPDNVRQELRLAA